METNKKKTTPATLTVSAETANFVDCMEKMQTLYASVYTALETLYDNDTTEKLIQERFYVEFKALEKRIASFMVDSIVNKIGELNCNEI